MAIPTNQALYDRVKRKIRHRYKKWSAYASGALVKEYKRLGGTFKGSRSRSRGRGIGRWFKEKWIDACKLPKKVPCGRRSRSRSPRKYPYCRPTVRVSSKTPRLASQIGASELARRCRIKRKSPSRRVSARSRSRKRSRSR